MGNKYLFANLSLFESGEGNKATSPSFAAENGWIDAFSLSLEAPIAAHHMRGDANGSVLTMANKYPFANILLFENGEGNEGTPPSFATESGSIDAFSSSLKAPIATRQMCGDANRSNLPMANNAYLLIFYFLQPERVTKQCLTLLQLKMWGLVLLACCLKRSLQHSKCKGGCKREQFNLENKCLFADYSSLQQERATKQHLPLL